MLRKICVARYAGSPSVATNSDSSAADKPVRCVCIDSEIVAHNCWFAPLEGGPLKRAGVTVQAISIRKSAWVRDDERESCTKRRVAKLALPYGRASDRATTM